MLKTSTKHATSYISIILTLLGSSAWGSDYQDAFLRSTWIVVGKKSTADYAANLITSKGMPFALVAYAVSGDLGSSGSGGDLGITKCSSFVGPIAEVLCNAPFGTIIGPIQTEFGWSLHLVSRPCKIHYSKSTLRGMTNNPIFCHHTADPIVRASQPRAPNRAV